MAARKNFPDPQIPHGDNAGNAKIIVEREVPPHPREPYKLVRLAHAAGMDARAFLAHVLARTATFADAAAELEVDEHTLWRWRRRLDVEVAR